MKKLSRNLLALLVSGTSLVTVAQEGGADAPDLYQVELIVFEHLDRGNTTAEIPRMPKLLMDDLLDQDLARPENVYTDRPDLSAPAEPAALTWSPVDPAAYLLDEVASRVERVSAYRLLAHIAWRQTAPDVSEAVALPLAELGVADTLLTGDVNLFQQRYLHLALDVRLGNSANAGSGGGLQLFAAPTAVPAIADSRRIRLEELHYFDQPRFGVIAMVARVSAKAAGE